jgi:DNA-binding SARP family transcriptional activator/Tfp pilus assembly protein PilF
VEVWDGGAPVPIGGPQQRALLAVLLVNAGGVISADRLIDHLWGERPPGNARSRLHGSVADLRKVLRERDGRQPLRTRAPGYLLEVRPGELDADRFQELVVAARRSRSVTEAARQLDQALALWRGRPLDGVEVDGLAPVVTQLAESHLEAIEARVDVDLRLGRDQGLVAQLQALVREHPVRERLWVLLMMALHRAGRRADALAAYRELREALVDELGVEPGEAAQRLHQSILAGDQVPVEAEPEERREPVRAPQWPVPAQLPAPVPAFTGRTDHLKQLDELADNQHDMVIATITGMAGAGKTALAVHWAHQARHRFPDGQLYANLRGFGGATREPNESGGGDGRPGEPIEALAGFLRALGVPAERVPVELEPAAALYRSTLAGRRVLVVLDNAASAAQVRPLLPGAPGCLVVVTSRDRLRGLVARDGARRLALGVLTPDEASVLLARLLGADRVAAEPAAAAELTRLCAYLPLAVRVAAADVAGPIAEHVAWLQRDDRLSALEVDGDPASAVRVAFDSSYATLDPAARRLFRLLGLVPAADHTAPAAAALADLADGEAAGLLDRLAAAHLLEPVASGRYTCHDLLASYAAERAWAEDAGVDREQAVGRWLGWYVAQTRVAASTLNPEMLRLPGESEAVAGFGAACEPNESRGGDHQAALAWLDGERSNLVAAVRHAAATGPAEPAWLLADALRGYFWLRMYGLDWLEVASAGLAAATAAGDVAGQAAAHLSLGDLHSRQARYDTAIDHYGEAVVLNRQIGWTDGESAALGCLGNVRRWAGDLPAAAEHYAQALALAERTGRVGGQAANLANLGVVNADLGQLARSADYYRRALLLDRQVGSTLGEAVDLSNIGELELKMGRLDAAFRLVEQALARHREVGDREGEADTTRVLAEVHRAAGHLELARELARRAVTASQETGGGLYEAYARNALGRCELSLGRVAQAVAQHERALSVAAGGSNRHAEVEALTGLAAAHPEPRLAVSYARRAFDLARGGGYQLLAGHALQALGDALARAGDPDAARVARQEALAALTACGSAAAEELRKQLPG